MKPVLLENPLAAQTVHIPTALYAIWKFTAIPKISCQMSQVSAGQTKLRVHIILWLSFASLSRSLTFTFRARNCMHFPTCHITAQLQLTIPVTASLPGTLQLIIPVTASLSGTLQLTIPVTASLSVPSCFHRPFASVWKSKLQTQEQAHLQFCASLTSVLCIHFPYFNMHHMNIVANMSNKNIKDNIVMKVFHILSCLFRKSAICTVVFIFIKIIPKRQEICLNPKMSP
jgi:hypothetical protein